MKKNLFLLFISLCLIAGQFSAAARIAFAYSDAHTSSLSRLIVQPDATLLGVKVGTFHLTLDSGSDKTSVRSKSDTGSLTVVTVPNTGTKKSTTSSNPFKAFAAALPTITSTPADSTSTSDENDSEPSNPGEASEIPTSTSSIIPTSEPTQAPTQTPEPTVTRGTNLVPNPSFEVTANGFASNWTTDSSYFTLDTNSQGNNGTNSIHYLSTSGNPRSHLFSERFSIIPSEIINWHIQIKVIQGPVTVHYFVYEYDENGNWVTGRIRMADYNYPQERTQEIQYIPGSSDVRKARLQIIVETPGEFYLDSVHFSY